MFLMDSTQRGLCKNKCEFATTEFQSLNFKSSLLHSKLAYEALGHFQMCNKRQTIFIN